MVSKMYFSAVVKCLAAGESQEFSRSLLQAPAPYGGVLTRPAPAPIASAPAVSAPALGPALAAGPVGIHLAKKARHS